MENGLRYNKKGYKEINSRIGRRFFDLTATTRNDIFAICRANGLTDEGEIKKGVERCGSQRKRPSQGEAFCPFP